MKIIVLDTETTSLDKPFCYNLGYIVFDTDALAVLAEREYVVEQVWHNTMCFASAYYADKRPIYVDRMRKHEIIMDKWGYAMGQLRRDIKNFEVAAIYAYNSDFDERVINFNCEWFKTLNPLDTTPIFDIWGMAQQFIVDDEYKRWAEAHGMFTDTGNYKTSAEAVTQYLISNMDFVEEHTALADSVIELEILRSCVERGAELLKEYKAVRCVKRDVPKNCKIYLDDEMVADIDYHSVWKASDLNKIRFKS